MPYTPSFPHHNQRGFTLVELAIVLGVVGIVFFGIWQLTTNMQRQAQDSQIASQIKVLANGVDQFIQNNSAKIIGLDPNNLQTACPAGATPSTTYASFSLNAIPANTGAGANVIATATELPKYLPPGFPLDARYAVSILRVKDSDGQCNVAGNPVLVAAIAYRHPGEMADTRGARLAGLLGAPGGFVYNTTSTISGANGGWAFTNMNQLGFAGPTALARGDILYYGGIRQQEEAITNNFLSRINTGNPEANTMRTPIIFAPNL